MKSIFKALADFQQEVPVIKKNAQGYGYKFADLEQINEVIKPLLKKHGLGYTQPLNGNQLKTIVFHIESGETIEGSVDIPQDIELKGQNAFQVMGSAITYFRRYSLVSTLGLVTDEDADAATPAAKTHSKPTEKQLELIRTLAKQQGMPDEAIEQKLKQVTTAAIASATIEKLKS